MDVYSLVIAILTKLLTTAGLNDFWLKEVLSLVEKLVTPACIAALEEEARAFLCTELRRVATANPSSVITAEIVAALCSLIGCPQSPPLAPA